MAKAQWCGGYDVAKLLLDRCLRHDGSLFSESVDRQIWTAELAAELDGRVGTPDESKATFMDKLERQLDGLDADAIQLTAELLYIELLGEGDTGGDKKEEHLERVLALADGTTAIPGELREALHAGGVATYGAGKNRRDAYLRFLVRFAYEWKSRPHEEQQHLADSPWEVLKLVNGIRTSTDALAANALLHLLFPDTFEYMISPDHRAKLLTTFSAAPGVTDAAGEDQRIQAVREATSTALGREVELYEEPFKSIWSEPVSARWGEIVYWARRFYEWPRFDESERDYKLHLAEKVAEARTGGDEWLERLSAAFKDRRNNLTDWRAHDDFLTWCEAHPDEARSIFDDLWNAAGDPQAAIAGFLEATPTEAVSGPGTRLTIGTFLMLGANATGAPFFKTTVYREFLRLLGRATREHVEIESETVYRPADLAASLGIKPREVRRFLRERFPREEEHGSNWVLNAEQAKVVVEQFGEVASSDAALAKYQSWVQSLEELQLRLLADGCKIRDLLDAQGIAYWLVTGAPDDWSDDDKRAFERFRQGEEGAGPDDSEPLEREVVLPAATADLASTVHLPQEWLQDKINLLAEKKQVIFYGPPGTGKTFVALKLADHLTAHGGEARLVQFHPSYTYEDFFEGYRPVDSDNGPVKFELLPGPLREMAQDARENPDRPYLLIVDEINRGNVAKVFGELYFLLEYRDREIQLQYSREELFSLPPNLFVIGTMNTADRSIALVDSALRRRFYFAGFLPTEEPVKSLLAKWLEANGLQPEPAELLEALNEAIGDDDFSIGPSYFITSTGAAPDIDRVWEHAIKPLLEERFYGSGRDIEAEFSPETLERRIAEAADVTPIEEPASANATDT